MEAAAVDTFEQGRRIQVVKDKISELQDELKEVRAEYKQMIDDIVDDMEENGEESRTYGPITVTLKDVTSVSYNKRSLEEFAVDGVVNLDEFAEQAKRTKKRTKVTGT